MILKSKKCKGTGLALGYGCGKLTQYRKYGLCRMGCYNDWLLNSENGKIKMAKVIFKIQKPRKDFEQLEIENKSRTKLKLALANTKTVIHKFVRERDKNKPCISCGCDWNDKFQAGHFYPAGSFETLKFNLDNINGQCEQCNLYKSGNFENYSLNLPKRIGQQRYNELVKLAEIDKQFSKVWDIDKLKEIQKSVK
jgi:hypothetical protein